MILLLYIMFPIIEELINFKNALKSIKGEIIEIIVKNKYTIKNPETIPYKKPPIWLHCFINGSFAIKSVENLKNNKMILKSKKIIKAEPIFMIVDVIFWAIIFAEAFLALV